MANFNTLPRTVTAAIGALVLSTAFIAAAVAPAQATGQTQQTASIAPSAQAHA
jgi:hypothetical protein